VSETWPGSSGSGATAGVWSVIVTIAGVDQSSRLVGPLTIDAEEDAARVADLTLRPPAATPYSVQDWVGKSISIDVADLSSGSPTQVARLFTGVIDTPTLDLDARTIALRCTDGLQEVIDALSAAQIDSLIPAGIHSPAIFDPAAAGWAYAQDRLSTVRASLDLTPQLVARVTDWLPAAVADLTFTAAHLLDGSLSVSLAGRNHMVNLVEAIFAYRFPRVKAEGYDLDYHYVDSSTFAAHVQSGKYFLQRSQVEQAIQAAGGTIQSISYDALPTTNVAVGSGFWSPKPEADKFLCQGFSAVVSFDYAQQIEETHVITVAAPNSVSTVGARRDRLSGALEGQYPPIAAAESAILLNRNAISGTPPLDRATPASGVTVSAEVTLSDDTGRAAADLAMSTLIEIAKTRIWQSHRHNSVSASVALNPSIDLDQTIAISVSGLSARGKCQSLSHRLDPQSGEAVTDFSLAICSVAGAGTSHHDTPTMAPAGTSPGQTALSGTPTADFKMGASEDHSLTVTFPGVEPAERNRAQHLLTASFDAGLSEDLFSVTL
jgi:hypothetical protein